MPWPSEETPRQRCGKAYREWGLDRRLGLGVLAEPFASSVAVTFVKDKSSSTSSWCIQKEGMLEGYGGDAATREDAPGVRPRQPLSTSCPCARPGGGWDEQWVNGDAPR